MVLRSPWPYEYEVLSVSLCEGPKGAFSIAFWLDRERKGFIGRGAADESLSSGQAKSIENAPEGPSHWLTFKIEETQQCFPLVQFFCLQFVCFNSVSFYMRSYMEAA